MATDTHWQNMIKWVHQIQYFPIQNDQLWMHLLDSAYRFSMSNGFPLENHGKSTQNQLSRLSTSKAPLLLCFTWPTSNQSPFSWRPLDSWLIIMTDFFGPKISEGRIKKRNLIYQTISELWSSNNIFETIDFLLTSDLITDCLLLFQWPSRNSGCFPIKAWWFSIAM